MKDNHKLFIDYLKKIFRIWVLWLFILVDVIGVIINSVYININIPPFVFLILASFGFIYAGFKIFIETLKKIPSEELPNPPNINIEWAEGDAYSYQFQEKSYLNSEADKNEEKKVDLVICNNKGLPRSQIIFNYRIENIGQVSVDIVAINVDINIREPFHFLVPEAMIQYNKLVKYPIKIRVKDNFHFNVICKIQTYPLLTEAQIAIRIKEIISVNKKYPVITLIEATNPNGESIKFKHRDNISLKPLCNLMINYWKDTKEIELLRLAGKNKDDD